MSEYQRLVSPTCYAWCCPASKAETASFYSPACIAAPYLDYCSRGQFVKALRHHVLPEQSDGGRGRTYDKLINSQPLYH